MIAGDIVKFSGLDFSPRMMISSIDEKSATCIWFSKDTQELLNQKISMKFLEKVLAVSEKQEQEIDIQQCVTLKGLSSSPIMIVTAKNATSMECTWFSKTTEELNKHEFELELLNIYKPIGMIDVR